jgi:heme A synthase
MALEEFHFLNAFLLMPLMLVPALLAFRQYRKSEGINPPLQAATILAHLSLALQIYLGVSLLHERHRRSLTHYSLGLFPVLLFLVITWFGPQEKGRRMLALAIVWLAADIGVVLTFFLG